MVNAASSVEDYGDGVKGSINKFLRTGFASGVTETLGVNYDKTDDVDAQIKAVELYKKRNAEIAKAIANERAVVGLTAKVNQKIKSINSIYDEIYKNEQKIADSSYILANARAEAATKMNQLVSLLPKELVPAGEAFAQSKQAKGSINQKVDDFRRAKTNAEITAENAKGKPEGSKEDVAAKSAAAEFSKVKADLKNGIQEVTTQLIQSMQSTAGEIKSLGGESFKNSFKAIEEATRNFNINPTEQTKAVRDEAIGSFRREAVPQEQKKIIAQGRRDKIGSVLGNQEKIRTESIDYSKLIGGLKDFGDKSKSDSQRTDALAEIEPLLKKFQETASPELFEKIIGKGGFTSERLADQIPKAQIQDKRAQVEKENPSLSKDTIDAIVKDFADGLQTNFDEIDKANDPKAWKEAVDANLIAYGTLSNTLADIDVSLADKKDLIPEGIAGVSASLLKLVGNIDNASTTLEKIGLVGKSIGSISQEAEAAIAGASDNITKLQENNKTARVGVESLQKGVDAIISEIKKLQDEIKTLTAP